MFRNKKNEKPYGIKLDFNLNEVALKSGNIDIDDLNSSWLAENSVVQKCTILALNSINNDVLFLSLNGNRLSNILYSELKTNYGVAEIHMLGESIVAELDRRIVFSLSASVIFSALRSGVFGVFRNKIDEQGGVVEVTEDLGTPCLVRRAKHWFKAENNIVGVKGIVFSSGDSPNWEL